MSDALERVLESLEGVDDIERVCVTEGGDRVVLFTWNSPGKPRDIYVADLRAVCAELTALRGARSWERWTVVGADGEVHDTFTTKDEAGHYLWNPGERVIRVRITEIPEDGQ